jgi:hypothetical protein
MSQFPHDKFNKNLPEQRLSPFGLDFRSGYATDLKLLADRGLDVSGYNPYYRKDLPEGKFDTILCFYVLNVLFPEEQLRFLMSISNLLKRNRVPRSPL